MAFSPTPTTCWNIYLLSLAINKMEVVKWHQYDLLGQVAVLVDLASLFRMVWEGWVTVSLKFHQAVTPHPFHTGCYSYPRLFPLSYGRNVPLHEKRSLLLTACHGSSPVLSQDCQDMDMLSHACNHPPVHQWRMWLLCSKLNFAWSRLFRGSISVIFFFKALLTHAAWFLDRSMLQFVCFLS